MHGILQKYVSNHQGKCRVLDQRLASVYEFHSTDVSCLLGPSQNSEPVYKSEKLKCRVIKY